MLHVASMVSADHSKQGVETLTRHAFDSQSDTTSRNALRVLCNTLFLKRKRVKCSLTSAYEAKACAKLKNDNRDDEFLVSRLIFLTTYGTNINLNALIEKYQLSRHHSPESVQTTWSGCSPKHPLHLWIPCKNMALGETAKLLFNVSHFSPKHLGAFTAAVPHAVTLLRSHSVPSASAPLQPPFGLLVNALLNLDLEGEDVQLALYPKEAPNSSAERLVELLDLSMRIVLGPRARTVRLSPRRSYRQGLRQRAG